MTIKPVTHRARGRARRDAVLEAAVEVIAERGLEGVTHRSVAERAAVPLSTTSYFFASLDELVAAAIGRIAAGVVADVERLIRDAADGGIDRDGFADRLVALLAGGNARDVIVQFEAYLACERRPELHEPVRQIMLSYEKVTRTALRAVGIADPAPIARQFVAVIDGFALHRIAWPRDGADRAAPAAVLRRLLDSYLREDSPDD